MKTTTFVAMAIIGMLSIFSTTAQNNVGIGTTTPDASAVLDASSTTQGFLPPRMTKAERNIIAAPVAPGLIVWCTNCGPDGELQVYNGTSWTNTVGGAASNPITVQNRLDGVIVPAETPKQIYDSGMPLDSLYGKIYKGGLIAYLNTTTGTGLIAATNDFSGAQWGCRPTLLAGASGTAVGTGKQNTVDILAGCSTSGIAARLCDSYNVTFNGILYDDWFLPSLDETAFLYTNLYLNNLGGFVANGTTSLYWSSSQADANGAYRRDFTNGGAGIGNKDNGGAYYVRAVREF